MASRKLGPLYPQKRTSLNIAVMSALCFRGEADHFS
jgi:hypothetical protein